MQVLPFVHVRSKENERGRGKRATLDNFVGSSLLELLLNESEDAKDIVHMI